MDARFLQSVHAKGAKVCGSDLRPFSLSHRVALAAIDSPFLEERRPVRPDDLLLALRICATLDPHLHPVGKPTWREKVQFARWRVNPAAFKKAAAEFIAFIDLQASGPKVLQNEAHTAPNDLPWVLAILASLVKSGIPLEQAWRMNEGLAVWLHIAFARMDGAEIRLWSPEHEAAAAILKAELAKREPTP